MKTQALLVSLLFASGVAYGQTADQQTQNLRHANFTSMGEGFFFRRNIAVHVEKSGAYELLVPFKAIETGKISSTADSIQMLTVSEAGEATALSALKSRVHSPFGEQLTDAGFKSMNASNSIWTRTLGSTQVFVFLKSNEVVGFFKQGRTDLSAKLKNTLIVGYSEKKEGLGDDVTSSLTVQNSLLKFDLACRYGDFNVENGRISKDLKDLELSDLGFSLPVPAPYKDASGFLIGGMNPTNLLFGLTSIGGSPVAEISARARTQGNCSESLPLLAQNEDLAKNLAQDNEKVIRLGLTHQEIVKPLLYLKALIDGDFGSTFTLYGTPYQISNLSAPLCGALDSPFGDAYSTSVVFPKVTNLKTKKSLSFSLLHPYLINQYGFYGSHQNHSYLDPNVLVNVFDYLKSRK